MPRGGRRAGRPGEKRRCPLGLPFWDRVDSTGGPDACWPWKYALFTNGYGVYRVDGKNRKAHRIAWEKANDAVIPEGMIICHRCDNPACCNPAHLFLGTHLDNMRDKMAKGRHVAMNGESNPAARLTEAAVRDIRARYVKRSPVVGELAEQYGIHRRYVWEIAQGRLWRNVA